MPIRQNVALMWYRRSWASTLGVQIGFGPSSKVSATAVDPVVRCRTGLGGRTGTRSGSASRNQCEGGGATGVDRCGAAVVRRAAFSRALAGLFGASPIVITQASNAVNR